MQWESAAVRLRCIGDVMTLASQSEVEEMHLARLPVQFPDLLLLPLFYYGCDQFFIQLVQMPDSNSCWCFLFLPNVVAPASA